MEKEPQTDKSEVRNLLNVTGASIWLKDKESDDSVCRQAAGVHVEKVRGYRLKQKTGISGWVAALGQNVVVSDTREDSRYDSGVEQKMEIDQVLCQISTSMYSRSLAKMTD